MNVLFTQLALDLIWPQDGAEYDTISVDGKAARMRDFLVDNPR